MCIRGYWGLLSRINLQWVSHELHSSAVKYPLVRGHRWSLIAFSSLFHETWELRWIRCCNLNPALWWADPFKNLTSINKNCLHSISSFEVMILIFAIFIDSHLFWFCFSFLNFLIWTNYLSLAFLIPAYISDLFKLFYCGLQILYV